MKWHKDSIFPRTGKEWLKLTIPQLQSYIRDTTQPRTPVAPTVAPPATPTMAAPTPVIVLTPKVDKKLEFMKGIK